MALFCNSTILDVGLKRLSTLTLKLCLNSSDPPTKAISTSTAMCAGIKSLSTKTGIAASTLTGGRKLTFSQTSDISGRKCSTKWITHISLIGASTLIYITKCSSRSYSTSGPDKITVPAWSVHLLAPATST